MGELENRFDAIDVRKDGKQDVGMDFEAKKEAQRAFYEFAIKDAQGQIDMRHPHNIQLLREVKKLLERQDLECFALTQSIRSQMQTIQTGTRKEVSQEQEQVEIQKFAQYFSIPVEKLKELTGTLKEGSLNLDVLQLLEKYKKYIDENLVGLDPKYILKVKQSIGLRTLSIGKVVGDLRKKESDMGEFQNNKWILNEKIASHFERVDKAILPSCVFYIKYSQKAQADAFVKNYNKKYPSLFRADDALRGQNMELWLSETKKVLESPLDEEGNFKFSWFGFGTQIILDERRADSEAFLQEAQIPKVEETNLLSEEDKEIEKKAKLYYLAAVGVQIGLGSATWLAGPVAGTGGTLVSAGIDAADMFSSTEVLMDILQSVGLVDPRYRMEKTLFDNFMAGLGIIPGISIAVKQQKIAKFLSKFSQNQVTKAMGETAEELKNWLKGRTKLVEELGYSPEDIKKYTSFSVEDMLKISSKEERLKAAEIVLGQKLTQQQKDVIWEAHLVGKAPFTFTDIKEKIRILTRDNIFKENERKRLLQKGVCGEKGDPYKEFPCLEQHRNILGDISTEDIKGAGQNAVTVKSKTDGLLHKIPLRQEDVAKIVDEANAQSKFYLALQEGKELGEIPDFVRIPTVRNHPSEYRGLFSMELVEGRSLSTLELRIIEKRRLNETDEVLDAMTDYQIQQLLLKRGMKLTELQHLGAGRATEVLKHSFPDKPEILAGLQKAIEYLKSKGLLHDDLHAGNVLVDKDWNIYIIDFGMVKITNK